MSNHLSDFDYHSVMSSTTSINLDNNNVKEPSIAQNNNDNSILNVYDIQNILRKHYQPIVSAQNGVKDLRTQLLQRANSLSTDLHLEIKSLTKTINHPELNQELVQEIGSKLFLRLKLLLDFPPFILQHIVNNNINIKDIQDGFRLKRLELNTMMDNIKRLENSTLLIPDEKIFNYQSEADCDQYELDQKTLFTGQYLINNPNADTNNEAFIKLMKKTIKPLLDDYNQTSSKNARLSYLAAYKEYASQLTLKNDSAMRCSSLKQEYDNESNLEGVSSAYENMISHILQQIKTLLIPYPVLSTLLNGQVTIPSTQDVVIDPSTNLSLPGIYHILREHYGTDSFVSVSTYLLSLLQWQLSEEDAQKPLNAISQMDKVISTWVSKDLWSKINFDMFVSFTLLKGLPSKFAGRRDLLKDINKFISDRDKKMSESGDSSVIDSSTVSIRDDSSNMPIYKKLNDLIRTAVENKKLSDTMNNRDSNKQSSGDQNKKVNNSRYPQNNSTIRNIETAHNAQDTKYSRIIDDFKTKLYDNEILKSSNIGILTTTKYKDQDGNYTKVPRPYCAAKSQSSVCSNCFPDGTTTTSGKCNPPCLPQLFCDRCKMFGHYSKYCLQKKLADGTLIPK